MVELKEVECGGGGWMKRGDTRVVSTYLLDPLWQSTGPADGQTYISKW